MIEATGIAKAGGPLTKRISLAQDGTLLSDGSACIMARGTARRQRWDTMREFAACISSLDPHEAIALGRCAAICQPRFRSPRSHTSKS